jgi:hypothetical protein
MIEEWKTIPRYPHCEVSNTGRVRYKDYFYISSHGLTKQERPTFIAGFGYLQVTIVPEDKSSYGVTESVHNLVAEAFIGPRPDEGYRVDHKDENKLNNDPNNLQWLVHGHNTIKAQNTGGRRYFYEGELWLIKKLIAAKIPYKTIGKMFKCSTMLISDIKKGLKDHHIKHADGSLSW